MFTCENCHQQRSDSDRVEIKRWNSFVVRMVAPSPTNASIVCRRCSGYTKKIGYAAIAGLLAIGVVTLLFLDFVEKYM